jgi:hypothetical protein
MLESSFTVTITAEDLHSFGVTTVTNDLLKEVASLMEEVYQECMFWDQVEDALQAIEDDKE